jgi:acid phosphatase type 7
MIVTHGSRPRAVGAAAGLAVAALVLAGCPAPAGHGPAGQASTNQGPTAGPGGTTATTVTPTPSSTSTATLVAVGDIGACDSTGDEATAAVVARVPGVFAALGDIAYPNGSAADFARCYAPAWGRFRDRTRPTPGNHEYQTPGARGYFDYFGAAAGDPTNGYYSYDLGDWHIVVVNSNCGAVGGCQAGSAQERWLRADLSRTRRACTLAYWHHPLFTSSAVHPDDAEMRPVFRALYDAGAEVVLSGHNHQYERFAPQTPHGAADPARGVREFVVGTGGASHYAFGASKPNSEVRNATSNGVLRLTLRPTGYDWRFLPAPGGTFTDAGSASCH